MCRLISAQVFFSSIEVSLVVSISVGRKKIKIEKIPDERNRQVCIFCHWSSGRKIADCCIFLLGDFYEAKEWVDEESHGIVGAVRVRDCFGDFQRTGKIVQVL
jgi:hypothetical protein